MRPGFRHDAAAGPPLQDIVAYRRRGLQSFLDIAWLEQLSGAIGVVTPDSCQAVGLELQPDA